MKNASEGHYREVSANVVLLDIRSISFNNRQDEKLPLPPAVDTRQSLELEDFPVNAAAWKPLA